MEELNPLSSEEVERVKQLTQQIEESPCMEKITELFAIYDRDGNGKIDRNELKLVMTQVMPDASDDRSIDEMMNDLDANGDGQIDIDELVKNIMVHFGHN